jgi:hypothetical protein
MAKAEDISRLTQKIIERAGTELSDIAGNATEKSLNYAVFIEKGSRGTLALEAFGSGGKIAFKAVSDYAEGDKICTGACVLATTCEFVAISAVMLKYPGAFKTYVYAKGVSRFLIKYRDACKDAKGKIIPCP